MRRRTIINLMWLSGVMLLMAASFVAASEPSSSKQLAGNAIRAGKARDLTAVGSLTESLSHESVLVRQSAAWALSQLGEAAFGAVPSLTHALGDSDPRVRWGAAVTLGRIGRKAAISESALWQTTRDRDLDVRCAALIALRTVSISKSSGALPALIECLKNPATDVQAEAIATLAAIHTRWDDEEKRSVASQLANVFEMSNDDLRLAAAVLLGDLGLSASAAMTPLANATDDSDKYVQAAALRAVGRFADEVDQRWNRLSVEQRHELRPGLVAVTKLLEGRSRKSADITHLANQFQRLIDGTQLISTDRGSSLKRPAVSSVTAAPDVTQEAPPVTTPSSTSSPVSQWGWICGALLVCLGAWGLVRGLSSSSAGDSSAKSHMVEIPLAPQEPVAELKSTVVSEVDVTVQRANINEQRNSEPIPAAAMGDSVGSAFPVRTIEQSSSREVIDAVPQLISALVDENSRVRAAAAFVLSAIGTHWQKMAPAARTESTAVDVNATTRPPLVLGHVEQSAAPRAAEAEEAEEEIVRLVSDPVESLRSNNAQILGGIGTDTADISPTEPRATADDLDAIGRVHRTSEASSDEDKAATTVVAPATSLIALPIQAVPPLKLFTPHDQHEPVVAEAVEQPCTAANFIVQLEDADGDVRWRALQALQELGASAAPELIASLNHRNPAVRKSVIVALGQVGSDARDAMPAMLVALHDVNADVRCAAVDCMGHLGVVNHSVLQALMQALNDSNAEVRRYVATTLGRFGSQAREATTALQISSISDIAVKVRAAAQTALQRISEPQVEAA